MPHHPDPLVVALLEVLAPLREIEPQHGCAIDAAEVQRIVAAMHRLDSSRPAPTPLAHMSLTYQQPHARFIVDASGQVDGRAIRALAADLERLADGLPARYLTAAAAEVALGPFVDAEDA